MDITNDQILMSHNIQVYNDAKECIDKHGKVAVVQPTGTGKSYIAMQIMKDMGKSKKLVIAPSRNYLDFMEKNKFWDENAITFTYDYICKNSNNIDEKILELVESISDIGLIVIDEFHRAGAPEWGKALCKVINKCENAKILGLSATPIRSDKNRNMIDELFDGYSVGNTSLCEAVANNIIPKLHYILGVATAEVELNKMLERNEESKYFFDKIDRQINELKAKWNKQNTFKNTLKKYLIPNNTNEHIPGLESRHIVFLTRIKDLEKYTDTIKKWFSEIYIGYDVDIGYIHSNMTKRHNTKILSQFASEISKNTIKVIVTVQMLNESFHFDNVQSISMFRYTEATNVFIQQIGRALSAKSNSPYIFDFVDNFASVGYSAFSAGSNQKTEIDTAELFESFNNETEACMKDIRELEKKLHTRVHLYTQLLPNIAKQHGSLFDIPDTKLRNWATKQFRKMRAKKDPLTEKESLNLTSFIVDAAGLKWYEDYKKYNNLSTADAEEFKKTTTKLFECNCMNEGIQKVISDNTGIKIDTQEKSIEYYLEYVTKSTNQECKQIVRLVKALKENNTYDSIRYMRVCENTYRFTAKATPTFCINNMDKAYAYAIWQHIMSDTENVKLLDYQFSCEQSLLQRILRSHKGCSNSMMTEKEFIDLNKGLLSRDIVDNNKITREMLSYFDINSNNKLLSVIDDIVRFTENIDTFRKKSILILNGTIKDREVITKLGEDVDTFILRYKNAELIPHFRSLYNTFEAETIKYIAVALNNTKYCSIEDAKTQIDLDNKRARMLRNRKNIYEQTKRDRTKIRLSLINILGLPKNDTTSIEKMIEIYIKMVEKAVEDGEITFNSEILYRMHSLYAIGIEEYKDIECLTGNKQKMEEIDLLVVKPTLRNKIANTAKSIDLGLTFKEAAKQNNLYNNLTQRDRDDFDNILNSGVEHTESTIYKVMEGIEQLPSAPYKQSKKHSMEQIRV